MAQAPTTLQVKIEPVVPPGFPLTFANHTIVTGATHEFILSFFQVEVPATQDPAELARIKSARANCVVRVVLTPGHALDLFNALQAQLQSRAAMQEVGAIKERH